MTKLNSKQVARISMMVVSKWKRICKLVKFTEGVMTSFYLRLVGGFLQGYNFKGIHWVGLCCVP